MFVLALFLLVGLLVTTIFGRLLLERRLALGPTATITRPPASTSTPTLDFRATIVIAEIKTQQARKAAQAGIATSTPDATAVPTVSAATSTPPGTIQPQESQSTATPAPTRLIALPVVVGGATATEAPPSAFSTPTPDGPSATSPTPDPGQGTQTAEAEAATATALLFTPTATDTPLPTVTPTPTVLPVAALQAVTLAAIDLYAGPGVLYPLVNRLANGMTVRLEGRTPSGEWVHVCCINSINGWARQIHFKPRDNKAPVGAPANADGNDERWLAVQESTATPLEPLPTQTAIPDGDFPLFRHDAAGTGQVSFNLPTPPAMQSSGSAGGGISASPVIVGSYVIVPSFDNHLYNFFGNSQHWRFRFDSLIQNTPVIQEPYIYVIGNDGLLTALKGSNSGESAAVSRGVAIDWQKQVSPPRAALNIRGNTLFVTGEHTLYALKRLDSGQPRWTFNANPPGLGMQYPAIGDQLIYVGDAKLTALDIYSGTVVWQHPEINGVTGPPVYAGPLGDPTADVYRLAEVYVAETGGAIHALDANTGDPYWRVDTDYELTSLAVDDTRVYAAGKGVVLALDRRTGVRLWDYPINPNGILGGPLVGNNRVLVADANGIYVLDAVTGARQWAFSQAMTLQPAVSNGLIYIPSGADVYSVRINN
jgi:outer membrane protein assembly factor BamB